MEHLDLGDLRVVVTDEDIATARRLWLVARDDDDGSEARVTLLFQDLCQLMSAQAQQIADDLRSGR